MIRPYLKLFYLAMLGVVVSSSGYAQSYVETRAVGPADIWASDLPVAKPAPLNIPVARPRMAPDLALSTYLGKAERQLSGLASFSDRTVVDAELPSSAQKGRFTLRRAFNAPKNLVFTSLGFVGDNFVKANIITRLLQSEVDHVQQGDGPQVAITASNYKFAYKGTDQVDGNPVHVFQTKPRTKRLGLFKGKIYLDVYTGSIRRAEGTLAKSPSFFIKKVTFVQDYAQVGDFNLPSHIHSIAETRLVGKAIVDISHDQYQLDSSDPAKDDHSTVPTAVGGNN